MTDEITSIPAPTNTSVPQTPETPISTPLEAVIVPAPAEAPTEPVPVSEPIPEEQTAHLGGNEPFEPVTTESIPPIPAVETLAETLVTEPAPAETTVPEAPPAETTQPTPTEPVIETVSEPTAVEISTLTQSPTEAPLVAQVETPAPTPTQTSEPVVVQVSAPVPTSAPVIQTPAPETTPSPAQVIATIVTPVVAPIIAQTFTKSIRELFTKAQLTIQNRKRKKLDRIISLFAKQTMITNNEVEKLLHISDATATRYLSTLEKEGRIKQNKKTGKGVSYSKI